MTARRLALKLHLGGRERNVHLIFCRSLFLQLITIANSFRCYSHRDESKAVRGVASGMANGTFVLTYIFS